MEELSKMLNRLLHRGDEEEIRQDELKKQIDAIYRIYAGTVGPEQLIINAGKYDALKYIHDENPGKRLLGLQRLILESRDYHIPPSPEDMPVVMDKLETRLSELLARRAVEERLERKIAARLEERQQDYVNEIRKEILKEEGAGETEQERNKLEKLKALDEIHLTDAALAQVRPQKLSDIVGQDDAVKATAARIASPYPQHLILYGPPGVGKTTTARLVLEEAKKRDSSVFGPDAPFVECDGTTLRWDNRDMTNPLIGSVHDPIYQGARRNLADSGIPEPKPGLVTRAHGGILFIDEIGELDPLLLNKLLKVLEDKRVFFESAYYDEDNKAIPSYIRKLFRDGAPADFILVGATTRQPEEICPAIRSRCAEVFFNPLQPEDISRIVREAATRLHVKLEDGVPDMVSEYTMAGRKAVSLLTDAYSLSVYEADGCRQVTVTRDTLKEAARSAHLTPWQFRVASPVPQVGHIYGLGVAGYWGSTIEIEAVVHPLGNGEKGTIHFNDTAGSMARDSVTNASSVVRMITGKNLSDYDVHVNVVGGGNIDGPSAGAAITCAIISALTGKPLRQDIAVTGEISLSGRIKPVGGIAEKAFGAHQGGMKAILIPKQNAPDMGSEYMHMKVIPVDTIQDILEHMLVRKKQKMKGSK